MDTCGKGVEMSKQKSYADITAEHIKEATEQYGWRSDVTANYIQAKTAINLALIADVLVEIYGSERRKEIDKENIDGI